jgi:prepilin-type N-terminal cleavage/methylation domain-containing protein
MKTKGFTLIELLVVLALIAILASVLIVIIKPAEIFKRGRDTQRQGDLRNLSAAIDAYIAERAQNSSLGWTATCSKLYYSVSTTTVLAGWPPISSPLNGVTGTTSTKIDGTGWVPLNFSAVSYLNLANLPLDPRNGQSGKVNGITTVFAYSFACNPSNVESYKLSAKLEGPTSTMTSDGGLHDCPSGYGSDPEDCLYEVGPAKREIY